MRITVGHPTDREGPDVIDLITRIDTPTPFAASAWPGLLGRLPESCAVAQVGQELVGVAFGYATRRDPSAFFLWCLAVDEGWRHREVPSLLMSFLLSPPDLEGVEYIHAPLFEHPPAWQDTLERLASGLESRLEFPCAAPLAAMALCRIGPLPPRG